jgi:UDP-2,3-diacylglucosamine hydrolase
MFLNKNWKMKNEKLNIKKINLKDGAVIIADVHYKKGDEEFLNLLKKWLQDPPSQVFFLGDIFHLLLPFKYLIDYNKEAIELINKLAEKTEVNYTTGNHDFNISSIFRNVIIADAFVDEEKSVFLTHGDLTDNDKFYKAYVFLIRNYLGNIFINFLTFNFLNNWLFKKILKKKVKCNKISAFKEKVFSRIVDIKYKNIIEGHYHQDVFYDFGDKCYLNVSAYVCNKKYYKIEDYYIKEKNGNRRQNIKGRLKRT